MAVSKVVKRLYGTYNPISEEVKEMVDNLYDSFKDNSEYMQRQLAYIVASNSELIDQDVLFAGATAINDAYMLRNTHDVKVKGSKKTSRSLKLRDFKDSDFEKGLQEYIDKNAEDVEIVARDLKDQDVDKRDNFTIEDKTLYRVKSGPYAGVHYALGKKDGKDAIFLDIANTPFEKLTKGWQESNFDPFEFAYKLVSTYPDLCEEDLASIVHVYWVATNTWAIEYKNPMARPYCLLDRNEQVKDGDNVLVAHVFESEVKKQPSINQEICKDICKVAKSMLERKLKQEQQKEVVPASPKNVKALGQTASKSNDGISM